LFFACELDPADLAALFADGSVVEQLQALDAAVALGLRDLSDERAAVVARLNNASVPVIAWLLLPPEQGYWFNAKNAHHATARYDAFRTWTAAHALRWEAIGIDVEPDLHDVQLALANPRSHGWAILRRVFDDRARREAERTYRAIVTRANADGYAVHSYELPIFDDERRVGASLLQRILGVVDVGADVPIPMLYTSFMGVRGMSLLWSYGPFGSQPAALLWSFGRGKQAIFIGSTGGGVTTDGVDQIPPLTWDAFARDLRLASRLTGQIGVFSLEGCVRQGFLERLGGFDWNGPADVPVCAASAIDRWRAVLRAVLWVSARPYMVVSVFAALLALRLGRRISRGKRRAASVHLSHT
jgi:hypothetical protein